MMLTEAEYCARDTRADPTPWSSCHNPQTLLVKLGTADPALARYFPPLANRPSAWIQANEPHLEAQERA